MAVKTILIADDDESMVRTMTIRCRNLKLAVLTASDATQAITRLRSHAPPSLIVLDMNMPGGGAPAVCEHLRTGQGITSIPVIILTGDTNNEVMMQCQSYGAFYVPKSPYYWQTLKPMIGRLLNITEALHG